VAVSNAGVVAGQVRQTLAAWMVSRLRGVRSRFRKRQRYPILFNVNGADESTHHKRALIVYLAKAFMLPPDAPEILNHQKFRRSRQIAALLGDFGYVVDVADVSTRKIKSDREYDLVMKDRVKLEHVEPARNGTVRIVLATTTNHVVHNRNLRRRHELLFWRRGRRIRPRRIYKEEMPFAAEADAIIGVGNEYTLGSWREVSKAPIYPFNNFGFPHTQFIFKSKDFSKARKSFLFFASGSQVQKGLDLVLEIFPRLPELHLYICSGYRKETDFCSLYRKELFETPNIHPRGWVQTDSPEFYDLVARCAYVIHPSCSDGQAGAVVQCMYAGLIPLVTKEVGVDTEDFGVTFSDDSVSAIEKEIMRVAALPEEWHREHSLKTRKVAEEKYSETAFIMRLREIMTEVLPRGD
jgi:glycosyltransferase involved in cell wall biosynthesis